VLFLYKGDKVSGVSWWTEQSFVPALSLPPREGSIQRRRTSFMLSDLIPVSPLQITTFFRLVNACRIRSCHKISVSSHRLHRLGN